MSTPVVEGRRRSAPPGRAALIGLMLIALTGAMIALAGTSPREIGAPVGETSRVSLDQRTFVCDAKLPQTSIRRGSVVGGPGRSESASSPQIVRVPREQARGAYAAETAADKNWSAWQPCPEAHARWWFVGAGGASVTHSSVLYITNPRAGAAVVDVDAYGDGGAVEAPGLHGITVPGGSTTVLNLATVAPEVGELGVSVLARRGLVAVSATDRFAPGAVGKRVQEWIPATLPPAKEITLAGLPARPSAATLLLVNPGEVEVVAEVEVIGTGSTFKPEGMLPVTLPPKSVRTLSLSKIFDGSPLAVRVTGTGALTATIRASRTGDIAFAAGVRAIRGRTAAAVPDGRQRELVLSSIGGADSVIVHGYDAKGERVLEETVKVMAEASIGVNLPKAVAFVRLESRSGDIVAGLSVVTAKGLMTAGLAPAVRSIRLPVVRQGF